MSATLTAPLDIAVDAGVMTLTLNRPDRLNALTFELLDAVAVALHRAGDDPAIRAVVMTGAGRGFCAGQDLTAPPGNERMDVREHLRRHYIPVITAMRNLDAPVIAAVNGVAAGAGLSLALACDMRIAARSAVFVQAFVRIGLVPDAGGSYFLPRLVGVAKATEMALLGDDVPSGDALRCGLVNAVVEDAELATEAAAVAARLVHGPASVGLIKRALGASLDSTLAGQMDYEGRLQADAAATDDFREGLAAFLGKRPPNFSGR
jgi:2-(1,2-epoxy-1,2-dihydrophenyl)acetyl-CoA isomerase